MKSILKKKELRLFMIMGGFFVTNALVAEFIGVKIFALEDTLGWESFNWNLFGQQGSLNFTAGVLLWPIVFIMTDIINEYFGKRGVKFLSYVTVGLILYAFIMIFLAIQLTPAAWWVGVGKENGVPNMNQAFANIFGQSNWIIVASVVAFFIGQIIDALIFEKVRKATGEKKIWLRTTSSTLVSQFIDSFIVLYIAFVLGPQKWAMGLFMAVGTVNYCYKVLMAFLLIPLIYLARSIIDAYLGKELSARLKKMALHEG